MWAWHLRPLVLRLPEREQGQDLAEYALLIGLIAILAIVGVTGVGVALGGEFNSIIDRLAAVL